MRRTLQLFVLGLVTSMALGSFPTSVSAAPASKKIRRAKPAQTKTGPKVTFETNKGKIVVRLFADKAPLSTKNLVTYVKEGFYNGTIFHRVIPDFMIQGGGFDASLTQKPTHDAIKNEAENGLSNLRGTLAMARTNEVNSATSQFFINVKDNHQLDHADGSFGYAVVGEVVEGMDVVDAIRQVTTRCPSFTGAPCQDTLPPGMRDVPKDAVIITRATVSAR